MDEFNTIERAVNIAVVKAMTMANEEVRKKFSEKLLVTRMDIEKAFDKPTFKDLTSRCGLKPVRQNGKNGRLYFKTSEVLKMVDRWYHT